MTQHPQPSAEALRTKIREAIVSVLEDAYDEGQEIFELTYAIDRDADKIVNAGMAALAAPGEVVNWEGMLRKEEQSHTNTIKQRDWAEETINAMYQAVIGHPPKWSNRFTYDDAVREVEEATLPDSTATPAPGGGGDAEEFAWVIERGGSDPSAPTYWAGDDRWSQDHMDAIRFARRVDAERVSARLHWPNNRICEHGWIRAHPPGGAQAGGALADVAAERRRQIEAEGWTPQHDDTHADGEMARAAACYAAPPGSSLRMGAPIYKHQTLRSRVVGRWSHPEAWPWAAEWWKPGDRRRELVKAAALIVAEIERFDRTTPPAAEVQR